MLNQFTIKNKNFKSVGINKKWEFSQICFSNHGDDHGSWTPYDAAVLAIRNLRASTIQIFKYVTDIQRKKNICKNKLEAQYGAIFNVFCPWLIGHSKRRVDMGVSKNNGTPKSSILIGFSIINHPFWGNPIFGKSHILKIIHSQSSSANPQVQCFHISPSPATRRAQKPLIRGHNPIKNGHSLGYFPRSCGKFIKLFPIEKLKPAILKANQFLQQQVCPSCPTVILKWVKIKTPLIKRFHDKFRPRIFQQLEHLVTLRRQHQQLERCLS